MANACVWAARRAVVQESRPVLLPSVLSSLQRGAEYSASMALEYAEAEAAQRKLEPGFVPVQVPAAVRSLEVPEAACFEWVAAAGPRMARPALPAEVTAVVLAMAAVADGLSESEAAAFGSGPVQLLAELVPAEPLAARAQVQPVQIALQLPPRRAFADPLPP